MIAKVAGGIAQSVSHKLGATTPRARAREPFIQTISPITSAI
jgi:hypothetical protein